MIKKPSVLLFKSRSSAQRVLMATPPLGILSIAASLRSRLGAEVRVIDALLERDPLKALRDAVRLFKPDVVGISALTSEARIAQRAAAVVKSEAPVTPVVVGGPHPSSDPELAAGDPNVDAVVIGEGEETFCELVRVIIEEGPRWKEPGTLRGIAGIAFRDEEGFAVTACRAPVMDLDSLPFPAWDLIDYRRFWGIRSMKTAGIRSYMPIFTSRGCPYRCAFCHHIFGKAFRGRSPESVAEETAFLIKTGTSNIDILDDIANFDPERFDGILEALLRRNLRPALSFPNGIRADLLRETSVDLLKEVGTGEVSIAVETATGRLQELIGKNLSLEKTRRAIELLAYRRIFTRGFFMLGFPTETEAEMRATIRYARDSRLHLALFISPLPFPNTELYDMYLKSGKMPAGRRAADYDYLAAAFNGSEVPTPEYQRLVRGAYSGFYLEPGRLFRILRDGPFGLDLPISAIRLVNNNLSFRHLAKVER